MSTKESRRKRVSLDWIDGCLRRGELTRCLSDHELGRYTPWYVIMKRKSNICKCFLENDQLACFLNEYGNFALKRYYTINDKHMSSAFVKESDEQWLHEIAPVLSSLIHYLTRENNGVRVYEKSTTLSKDGHKLHRMSNGLDYYINEKSQWTIQWWIWPAHRC